MFPPLIRFTCSAVGRNCFGRSQISFARNSSLVHKFLQKRRPSILVDFNEFKIIYRFNSINLPAGLSRMKSLLPILTAVSVPILFFVDYTGRVAVVVCCFGIGNYGFLWLISKFATNIIGTMYVNKTDEVNKIIIGSIDNSGKRVNRTHNLNDLLMCGNKNKLNELTGFVTIAVKDSDIEYKLNLKNCKIYDSESFKFVFGSDFLPNK